jgi:hypothetical protein
VEKQSQLAFVSLGLRRNFPMKKKLILLFLLLLIIGFTSVTSFSQCDRTKFDSIQCGYFDQGFQDGVNDAKNKGTNNYSRHKNKFEKRFEGFFRDGYDKGYTSIIPFVRWDKAQREIYDKGYKNGQEDKRRKISRLYERYEGDYPKILEAYYKAGYQNGYDGVAKQYDVKIEETVLAVKPAETPKPPAVTPTPVAVSTPELSASSVPTPTPTPLSQIVVATPQPSVNLPLGIVTWKGRVDDRVSISLQGVDLRNVDVSGTGMRDVSHNVVKGFLPKRPAEVFVKKLEGRGNVSVIQQPNRSNDYMAIIQISDPKPEDDKYKLEISWIADTKEEPYQAGKVFWSGKVDQSVQVKISGKEIQSYDESQTSFTSLFANMTGSLARRVGKVSVNKLKGRGTVTVIQQPDWENDFTATVQITDDEKGSADYQIEVVW